MRALITVVVLASAVLVPASQHPAKDDRLVEAVARLTDPDAQGWQQLKLTLKIKAGWHLYANPSGVEEYVPTTLSLKAEPVPQKVTIDYPPGKTVEDPAGGGAIRVYEKEVTIAARWLRREAPKGGEIEVILRYQACDAATCLPPQTMKIKVRGEKF